MLVYQLNFADTREHRSTPADRPIVVDMGAVIEKASDFVYGDAAWYDDAMSRLSRPIESR